MMPDTFSMNDVFTGLQKEVSRGTIKPDEASAIKPKIASLYEAGFIAASGAAIPTDAKFSAADIAMLKKFQIGFVKGQADDDVVIDTPVESQTLGENQATVQAGIPWKWILIGAVVGGGAVFAYLWMKGNK